jgi:hypothetical protein
MTLKSHQLLYVSSLLGHLQATVRFLKLPHCTRSQVNIFPCYCISSFTRKRVSLRTKLPLLSALFSFCDVHVFASVVCMYVCGASLHLQLIIKAHSQWLAKTRSAPTWTTCVFSSTVTNDERRITARTMNCLERRLSDKVKIEVEIMLRSIVSQPVCLGIKHTSWAWDQIFISVRQLQTFRYGTLSLTRGRDCRLPKSQSAVTSLLSVCTIHNLHVIKCTYIQHTPIQGLCQSRLSTADHALSLVAPTTTAV